MAIEILCTLYAGADQTSCLFNSVSDNVISLGLIRKTTEGDGVINSEEEILLCTPFISNIF